MLYDGNNNRFPDFFDMFMKKDCLGKNVYSMSIYM